MLRLQRPGARLRLARTTAGEAILARQGQGRATWSSSATRARRAGPGMQEMLAPTADIMGMGLGDKVALITDGRFSGGTPRRLHRPRLARGGGGRAHRRPARRRHHPHRHPEPPPGRRPVGRGDRAAPGGGEAAAARPAESLAAPLRQPGDQRQHRRRPARPVVARQGTGSQPRESNATDRILSTLQLHDVSWGVRPQQASRQ